MATGAGPTDLSASWMVVQDGEARRLKDQTEASDETTVPQPAVLQTVDLEQLDPRNTGDASIKNGGVQASHTPPKGEDLPQGTEKATDSERPAPARKAPEKRRSRCMEILLCLFGRCLKAKKDD